MGFMMFAIVAGLIGLTAWAVSSDSDSDTDSKSVAVAPRPTLTDIAPPGGEGIARDFNRAAHEILKGAAAEQARLALGGREGDISVWDEGDRIVWEVRSKSGKLIERGDIADLGRPPRN